MTRSNGLIVACGITAGLVVLGAFVALFDKVASLRGELDYLMKQSTAKLLEPLDANVPATWRVKTHQIDLVDYTNKVRASLRLDNDERPTLLMLDKNDKLRVSIGVTSLVSADGTQTKSPESSIYLFDPNGRPIWHAPYPKF